MLPRLIVALALYASLASPARADVQVFQGKFSLLGLGLLPVQTEIGVATVNGSGGGIHVATLELPGGLFSLHADVPITTTAVPLTSVRVDLTLGAGAFAETTVGSELQGPMAAPGNVRLCVLVSCGVFFDVPLTEAAPPPVHGIGLGGAPIVRPLGAFGTIALKGAVWETGTVSVQTSAGTLVLAGFRHGPLSNTSSTAAPQGVIQLVTPVSVAATIGGGAPIVVPLFGVLEVKLLPEPGALAALAAGGALLLFLAARRASAEGARSEPEASEDRS